MSLKKGAMEEFGRGILEDSHEDNLARSVQRSRRCIVRDSQLCG